MQLIDLNPLFPVPKTIPPEAEQLQNESVRFWRHVTEAIVDKKFAQATKLKQELEERQRAKAAARQAKNEEWKPRFFTGSVTPIGKPDLTDDGRLALKGLDEGNFHLEESAVMGA
jgi:phage protein D